MLPHLLPIGSLLSGTALLLLGTGLLNTLLALRGSLEGFSDQTLGLLGSAYFVGFFIGTLVDPRLIRRIGHIRAFAFFAAAITASVLLHVLLIDAWLWFGLRVITGIALVGLYAVIESWLNGQAAGERRGQIFSVYMTVNLLSLAAAQQFLRLDSPAAFTLFAVSATFVVVALMPVVATRLPPPALTDSPRLPLRKLWKAAPVALSGALASGLAMGAFWGLGAVYAGRMGMDPPDVALFITVTILAGALLQWPIGLLSDRVDRRRSVAAVAGLAAAGGGLVIALAITGQSLVPGALLFGGTAFAVYPIVVAHLIDHLHHDEILSGNAALLMVHGAGAAAGPALAGALMSWSGPQGLPAFFALTFGPIALFALIVSRRNTDVIVEEAAHVRPMLRTSPVALEMMTPEESEEVSAPETAPGPDTYDEGANATPHDGEN